MVIMSSTTGLGSLTSGRLDFQDLARASMDEVNEVWAGLGYYRRARFLLEGANFVMKEMGGVFPATSAELQKIPGWCRRTYSMAMCAFRRGSGLID